MGDILSLHVELTFVGLRYVVLFQFTPLALRRSVLDSVKMHAKCMYICYAPGYLLRIVQNRIGIRGPSTRARPLGTCWAS